MSYQKKERIFTLWVVLALLFAVAAHYLWAPWGFYCRVSEEEAAQRRALTQQAERRLGVKEADGSHAQIVDLYNTLDPLPVGYTLGYEDSWCAAFVTVAAMEAGLSHIIPAECGCERQIEAFKALDGWEENDNVIPQPGDLIYYDWDVTRQGNSTGWSDHVGIVVGVKWPFLKVIEGNKNDDVSYRIIPVGHRTIRGYGMPDYGSGT